jgi:hypothetical protein
MKTLWIDVLSFGSASKVITGISTDVDKIYYLNINKLFKPFVNFMSKVLNRPVIQLSNFSESDCKIDGVSIIQIIQDNISKSLDMLIDDEVPENRIKLFINRTGFSITKYREHIKESAYYLLYRSVEMKVISKKIGSEDDEFMVMSSPLKNTIKNILGSKNVNFYSFFTPSFFLVDRRKSYFYDNKIHSNHGSRFFISFKIIVKWLFSYLSVIAFSFRVAKGDSGNSNTGNSNIGVELIQSRVKLKDVNDIYWLKESNIDHRKIRAISFEDYDEKSLTTLGKINIKPIKIVNNPYDLFKYNNKAYDLVLTDKKYFLETWVEVLKLFPCVFSNNLDSWLKLQSIVYYLRSKFWLSIYQKLGIKMLWSMYDVDPEKMVKAQALELIEGLYLGSHWSNYPSYNAAIAHKRYDVLFAWGGHFITNNFYKYPYMAIYKVGYPSDHYFVDYKESAADLRNNFADKFVISLHDNIYANDISYSIDMLISIYNMLIDILKNYDNVVLLLKPKRRHYFDNILIKLPTLQEYILSNRVEVFCGETARTKAVPAEIGMASDLVVGLGISTTSAECCFAGTVSFHADLTGYVNNNFSNNTLGKVVFRDVADLELAIENQILGKGITIEECRELHKCLDPYQDGKAYLRVGSVLKQLQQNFELGMGRKKAIEKVELNLYDGY